MEAERVPKAALRDRHVELTRDLILEALAELIGEGHLAEFTMQEVADRAGVSHRTVYRHFSSREALLDGFVPWAGDRFRSIGALDFPETADDIAPFVRRRFEAWEQLAPLTKAFIKLESATNVGDPVAAKSLRTIRSALAEVTGGMDPELAEAVVWTVRTLWSHNTWVPMHDRGLDARTSGTAVAWAIDALIEALRDGRGPTFKEGESNERDG